MDISAIYKALYTAVFTVPIDYGTSATFFLQKFNQLIFSQDLNNSGFVKVANISDLQQRCCGN